MKVLLIEDDVDTKEMLGYLLEIDGCDVQGVEDGAAALNALEADHFDVAILDLMMPGGMGGQEMLANLRGHKNTPPVVVLTAMPTEQVPEGAAALLLKPVEIADLEKVLRKVAGKAKP